jgi:hypothetical protein
VEKIESSIDLEPFLLESSSSFTPRETHLFLKHFYNDEWNSGLSENVKLRLEEIIREDVEDYECEELALVHSAAVSCKLLDTSSTQEAMMKLLQSPNSRLTIEGILYMLNLKLKDSSFDL